MVRKKIGVVMETIQEKIEKSFKENSPRIAIKKGEKNTTYSEFHHSLKSWIRKLKLTHPMQHGRRSTICYWHGKRCYVKKVCKKV